MIKMIEEKDLPACLDVIHVGFMTVAEDFNLTPENCPTNGAFMPLSRLQNDFDKGSLMYGYFEENKIAGFMQLTKKDGGVFELNKLSVLPEARHKGYGKELVEFSRLKVRELGGNKISIGIIEENTILKNWYLSLGFVHTGTRVFEHLPFTVGFMELEP